MILPTSAGETGNVDEEVRMTFYVIVSLLIMIALLVGVADLILYEISKGLQVEAGYEPLLEPSRYEVDEWAHLNERFQPYYDHEDSEYVVPEPQRTKRKLPERLRNGL